MRTEAELTTKHTSQLRKDHPTWVVLKHCDRFTSGIPDVSVSYIGELKTVWIEYKLIHKDEELLKPSTWVNDKAQLEQTVRLSGYYLAYCPLRKMHVLIPALYLRSGLDSQKFFDVQNLMTNGDGYEQLNNLLMKLGDL